MIYKIILLKKKKRKLVVANTKQENIFTRVFLNKLYKL